MECIFGSLFCFIFTRYSSFCEIHQIFLCNKCKEASVHRKCRLSSRIIETTANITKAETKLNVINTLKRDERGKGKQLLKLIEQIDRVQERLAQARQRQVELYCYYVMQVRSIISLCPISVICVLFTCFKSLLHK